MGWADAISRAALLLRVPAEDLEDALVRHHIDGTSVAELEPALFQALVEHDLHARRPRIQILAALGQLIARRWADAE